MSIPFIILGIIFLIGSLMLIGAILLQKKRSAGLGSVAGIGNSGGATYWDKNKNRSTEGTLELGTKIGGAVLLVLSIVLCLV